MNSIEERDSLIHLMQEALKFYADKNNYIHPDFRNQEMNSRVQIDGGSQAQFALDTVNKLMEQNQKMQDEYDKLMSGYVQLQQSDYPVDAQELMKTFKVFGDADNNV